MINSFTGKYRFLSNFYLIKIDFEGITYPSTEHAFQASKTLDLSERLKISSCQSPGRAKRMGQLVQVRPDWEKVKISVMAKLITIKFSNVSLKKKLKATFPHQLVEGNNWGDIFWGICRGRGENHLGKILMKERSEIMNREMKKNGKVRIRKRN